MITIPEGFSILLAEDNPINQRVAILSLKRLGLCCDIAENGQKAVDMYMQNNYSLIFMDMQMPILDGVGAVTKIRSYEQEKQQDSSAWIIAVTANSFSSDREICLDAGMNDFINKPFTEYDLKAVIEKAIQHHP